MQRRRLSHQRQIQPQRQIAFPKPNTNHNQRLLSVARARGIDLWGRVDWITLCCSIPHNNFELDQGVVAKDGMELVWRKRIFCVSGINENYVASTKRKASYKIFTKRLVPYAGFTTHLRCAYASVKIYLKQRTNDLRRSPSRRSPRSSVKGDPRKDTATDASSRNIKGRVMTKGTLSTRFSSLIASTLSLAGTRFLYAQIWFY